jgi:hypothetical protein
MYIFKYSDSSFYEHEINGVLTHLKINIHNSNNQCV